MQYTKKPVGDAAYQVINMAELPEDVYDESCNDCPSNDSARIINPNYKPKLKQWLSDNGYNSETCYIAWWSW